MKICFFTVSLKTKITGIDMVAVNLANELVDRGHEVIFVTHPGENTSNSNLKLLSQIRIYEVYQNLNEKNIQLLRSILAKEKPDVAVPMVTNSIVALFVSAMKGMQISLVISEHNNPEHYLNHWWRIGRSFEEKLEIRAALFSAADRIHLLNESFRSSLPDFLQSRVCVIKNVCPIPLERRQVRPLLERQKVILSIGRLEDKQKNLSLLLDSFAKLYRVSPAWTLKIVGEGPSESAYRAQCQELGISQAVDFVGNSDTPEVHYNDAQIFAIPSVFEGCPLTLIEAQSFGLPAIGLESCSGVNEMLHNGVDGLLASGDEDFSIKLMELTHSDEYRKQLSEKASISSEKYSSTRIYDQWEDLLINASELKADSVLSKEMPRDPALEARVLLEKFLRKNIYWQFYPRNDAKYSSNIDALLTSTSWKITRPLRLFGNGARILKEDGPRQFRNAVGAWISRIYARIRNKCIKTLGRLLPKIDVVGVNVPNMTDIQDFIPELVLPENIIKSTTDKFSDDLKVARARIIVSAVGAVKRDLSNHATRMEIWHAAGAVKFFSNRTYQNISEDHLIMAPSEYMRAEYAHAFKTDLHNVRALGSPKTDVCFNEALLNEKRSEFFRQHPTLVNRKLYLYAPTYRGKWPDDVQLFLDLDFEALSSRMNNDEVLLTKLHPALRIDSDGREVRKTNIPTRYESIIDASDVDTITLLAVADVVISDYSSVIFETVLLNKPLVCYAEDIDRYDYERGLAFDYRNLIPGELVENPDVTQLLEKLRSARIDREKYQAFTDQFLSACDGNSVRRLSAIITNLLDSGLVDSVSDIKAASASQRLG